MHRDLAPTVSPITAVVGGVAAAAVGTVAMDLLLYVRYRRGGGTSPPLPWEFSASVDSWDQAPAPAQVGRRVVEGLFRRTLPDDRAASVNNITHWGYGALNGAPYGVVVGSLASPRAAYGLLFGAGVWATSYVVLPLAGLYKPVWEYDRRTLANDLSAHLVYGLTTGVVFSRLASRSRRRRAGHTHA